MEKFEYPYADEKDAILNWVTAGGRNTPEQTDIIMAWKDEAIVEDVLEVWELSVSKAELQRQLTAFRAEFAVNRNHAPEYAPKHPPTDRRVTIRNGLSDDQQIDQDVYTPPQETRFAL